MRKTIVISLLISCLFPILSSLQVDAAPSCSASSAILYDPKTSCVIYEKDAHRRRPMASTTKIMTALVAIESAPLDLAVKIPQKAVGVEGSSLYLNEGETLTLGDLLYGLMLASANDAATAIAIAISGSVEAFADKMNLKAASLGLTDTHFMNPHGLDHPEHYTTAYDLAIIAGKAMENPIFCKIVSTRSYTISATEKHDPRTVFNHNKLLALDDAIGIKTGFTKKSGRCLVSAAERDGQRLIAVTLNAPDDWNDHAAMLDFGFSELESICLAKKGELKFSLTVLGGEKNDIQCTNQSAVSVKLPHSAPKPTLHIELRQMRAAPIAKGEILGIAEYRLNGHIIASTPLVATESVAPIKIRKGFF